MERAESVIKYYVLSNKLKNLIRTGWTAWNVKRERIESVAEHVYSVQMLALAMYSQYEYDIDIFKVIMMLAVHEIGETVIGDLTLFQISKEEKENIEHKAVHDILRGLIKGKEIERLFLEFDEGKTKEARFAFQCDKLECDLQCKLYDEEDCVDLNDQHDNESLYDENVQKMLKSEGTWSGMWLKFGQNRYKYDDAFMEVSEYAKIHTIGNISKSGQ